MPAVLDHLVICSPDLTTGEAYVHAQLGTGMRPGGAHAAMGTHNALAGASLGGVDGYLEVIAVDPQAPRPDRPRWFGLDSAIASPHLATWVVRVDDPHVDDLGGVISLQRDHLAWRISVPADGSIPLAGAGPHLIAWDSPPPVMPGGNDRPLLVSLIVVSPDQERLRAILDEIDLAAPVTVVPGDRARLIACFASADALPADALPADALPADALPADALPAGVVMTSDGEGLDLVTERRAAVDLFHLTWRYLDREDRQPPHDVAMAACAEASLWHWRRVGAPTQWAIGEWQCSRVQAVLANGHRALEHAERALAIAEDDRVDDFVPASAHEALSRAYAVLGDMERARAERNIAYGLSLDLDNEERDIIEHDLGTIPII